MPLLSLLPIKAWIGLGILLLALGAYWKISSDAEQRGATTIVTEIQKGQTDAQDRAETERRRLDSGDDSRVRQFDRD
ncbi:hypothetical protein ASE61_15155 [Bosea sp. Root670]|uniref:hypothetical protein n=1 Tax=Bosea sp. Root670 TaxID=1736583 RepID=UPI00071570F7|nr:hypothetical protein [Bosea sp. Root670]KRE02613.1 hypothetical protein ASE61_15155 [Bosea sp. Root670]